MSASETAKIPGELRERPQWVLWKMVPDGADGKSRKLPINPRTNKAASSTDPQTWTAFDYAISNRNGHAGVGYVFTAEDPFCGIDFDGCRTSNGTIAPWALGWLAMLDSYSEVSPSGTGVKVWVRGRWPLENGKKIKITEEKLVPDKEPAIEVYDHGRYFAVTGQRLIEYSANIEERQTVLDTLCATFFRETGRRDAGPIMERARRYVSAMPHAVSGDGGHDQTFAVACALVLGFDLSNAEALEILREYNDRCEPKWTERDLLHKVEDADKKPGPRGYLRDGGQWGFSAQPESDAEPVGASGITPEDFYAYMPMHSYIHIPDREMWPASSVNARVLVKVEGKPVKASDYIDTRRSVEQMTWAPGESMLIEDRIVSEGGWIPHKGQKVFNLYRPSREERGDPGQAIEWVAHVSKLYPAETDHIIRWLAHRVQFPGEKINHALVLGGLQGVGKDTILEPVKAAVGHWNFAEVSPAHLLGRFNGFVKSVILRVSEARDLGDVDRFAFYDHMKTYTAAPPDVLRCDEKNLREYSVFNVCGVVITTNHKTDGIYLPPDDRRHYVAWTDLCKEDFPPDYWTKLYTWYASGGSGHVGAFLRSIDLSNFDPKAPPPKTDAFWAIADANRAPEDAELADVLDALLRPDAVTIAEIAGKAKGDFHDWLLDRRNSRQIPYRLEEAGYVATRNPAQKRDGLWKIGDRSQVIYTRMDMNIRNRIAAAAKLAGRGW